MKTIAFAFAAVLGLAVAAPAFAQTTPPRDTGNMAYPAPLPQGNVSTTAPTGPNRPTDTGNMAYPNPMAPGTVGAAVAAARKPTDTGSMAYPAPQPQGNVSSTRVR